MVNQQTSIIADERFDARIEGHTQLDGGLIASLDGDLTLDTGTFGFSDIAERARSDTRRATLNLGFGGGGSPSIGIEGELAHAATDAVTRATVGEGEIIIRDEAAQRAREEAGETRDVAALNRDLDAARETLRDERAGVRFYASDSSVRAAIEAVDFIGRTLSEISQEAFRNMDSASFDQIADALERDALTDEDVIAQLGACRPQHGFNLLHWLISPAHAAVTCRIETNDGQVIHFTREETEQCLELYLAIGERKPSEVQRWVAGLTILNAFAEPIGNLHALQSGPVIIGETEDGEHFTAMDAQGRFLYRNAVTGIYFYANPYDLNDTVTIGTAAELAGIFTGVSAASRVIARGAVAARGGADLEQIPQDLQTGFRGRRGEPLGQPVFQPLRNEATNIMGRRYSGHALDQMQNRGLMPLVVEDAIQTGVRTAGRNGTSIFYNSVNGVRVILNQGGDVVTVIPGPRSVP